MQVSLDSTRTNHKFVSNILDIESTQYECKHFLFALRKPMLVRENHNTRDKVLPCITALCRYLFIGTRVTREHK